MTTEPLTALLQAAADGDTVAREQLFEAVYDELRRLARGQLAKGSRRALNTTEVVHETYLRLFDRSRVRVADRQHFFALSSRVMRQVLVDHFRQESALRRGGPDRAVTLEDDRMEVAAGNGELILAVHEALDQLDALNPRLATVVEHHFFGGWSQSEIADALGVTRKTVNRDWRAARAWLARALQPPEGQKHEGPRSTAPGASSPDQLEEP